MPLQPSSYFIYPGKGDQLRATVESTVIVVVQPGRASIVEV